MKYVGWGFLILIAMFFVGLILNTCNTASRFANNALNTAYDQFSPSELLKKYEWFKDASAQCEQKVATMHTYESRFESIKQSYGVDSNHRSRWVRDDREQWNVWQSEYLGVKASYNDLAATYNAEMAKFNYRFCNVGTMPDGSTTPLPREFKPYITQ